MVHCTFSVPLASTLALRSTVEPKLMSVADRLHLAAMVAVQVVVPLAPVSVAPVGQAVAVCTPYETAGVADVQV